MPSRPNNDVAAISWLKTLPGVPSNGVASSLPRDNSTWEASGFVTIQVISGQPDIYNPINRPVVQILCWANKANSEKPPWGRANNLAEEIKAACYGHPELYGYVQTPVHFGDVRVLSCYLLSEPRRVLADEARFAVYEFELQMHWVAVDG